MTALKLVANNDDAGLKFADWLIEQYHAQYQPGQFDPAVNVLVEDGYPRADFVVEDAVKNLAQRGWEASPTRFNSAGCDAGSVRMRPYSAR